MVGTFAILRLHRAVYDPRVIRWLGLIDTGLSWKELTIDECPPPPSPLPLIPYMELW